MELTTDGLPRNPLGQVERRAAATPMLGRIDIGRAWIKRPYLTGA